jgi:hypothetical protein
MRSKLLAGYLLLQLSVMGSFHWLPSEGWLHASWQAASGWISAGAMVLGIRRHRPPAIAAWYAIAAGAFIASNGVLVEHIARQTFGVTAYPNIADAFWLSLYPGLIAGLGYFTYQRARSEDLGGTLFRTIVCLLLNMFAGILAWEFIVWGADSDLRITLTRRIMGTLYPLADLTLLAVVLRLLLGGGFRNASVVMAALATLGLLVADIGWSSFMRTGVNATASVQFWLEISALAAFTLLGAAALHPAMRDILPHDPVPAPRLGVVGWLCMAACVVTSPLVLLLQAILDHLYSVAAF